MMDRTGIYLDVDREGSVEQIWTLLKVMGFGDVRATHVIEDSANLHLEDFQTLASYDVNTENELHLRQTRGEMRIWVRILSLGKSIELHLDVRTNIQDVKANIQDKEGIAPSKQRLIYPEFSINPLDDALTLYDLRIFDDGHILLMDAEMRIFVKIPAGTTIAIKVDPDDSIRNVKTKIADETGIPTDEQRLTLDGEEEVLNDDRSLAHYNIETEARLKLQ